MKKMCYLLTMGLLAGSLTVPVFAASDAETDKKWTIATDTVFKPFEYTDDSGNFVGIDVDVLDAIAKDQGFEYELKSLGWDASIAACQAGQADGMIAGSDIWDSPDPTIHTTLAPKYENDAYIVTQMRESMHNILYTVVNSNAMNGWSANDRLQTITPWWKTALIALDTVLAVLCALCIWRLVVAIKRKKNTAKAEDQQ